ncbi:MAG: hypothetical protein WCW33_01960 [Candidatus Babeliales bacterium]|jgi:hypothetical protein
MKKYVFACMALIWCNTQCAAALQKPSTWVKKFATIFRTQKPSEDQTFVMEQIQKQVGLIAQFLGDLDTTHQFSDEDKQILIKQLEGLLSSLMYLTDIDEASLACAFVAAEWRIKVLTFAIDVKNTLNPVQQRRKSRQENEEALVDGDDFYSV